MNIVMIIAGVLVFLGICVGLGFALKGKGSDTSSEKGNKSKNRMAIIRDAEKILKQDPRNPKGLLPLADLYYEEKDWARALETYKTISDISPLYPNMDLKRATFRAGLCALETNNLDEAHKIFSLAKREHPDTFESNFYLGQTFYKKNQFDNAVSLLQKAFILNRDNQQVHEYLGLALYKKKNYKNAIPHLKAAFDGNPENKYIVYAMAESLYNIGKADKALGIFLHLRADPEQGVASCLYAGMIYTNTKQLEKAVKVYEIGLKHTNADPEIILSIKYNLAQTYLNTNKVTNALALLREIQSIKPRYRDTATLISRYEEMTLNSNLKTFLMAGSNDFLAFCRKMVATFYVNAHVKIVAVEVKPDMVEIQADIETAKWEDSVIFRFLRTTGTVGEFAIRDFHGRIKDVKAGKGIFISSGTYSQETKKFIDGRPIDLIDKEELLKLFNKVDLLNR